MARVHSISHDPRLHCNVSKAVLEHEILYASAVVRPLDVPSTNTKYGLVLSHSGVMVRTAHEDVLVEYMNESAVYINLVATYRPDQEEFVYRYYRFRQNPNEVQRPKRRVTVGEFAVRMAEFMKGKTFDTFTHNCHHARYLTMKYYGMRTTDPYASRHSVFAQGIADFFKRYSVK